EADHVVSHLWLLIAERYGATGGLGPEDTQTIRRRLLRALVTWADTAALAATLPPPMEQYYQLVEVFARYRALRDEGFVAVSKKLRKAKPGKVHPDLPALRTRLAQEDPQGAGEGDLWDDALTDALRRARVAYQLAPKRRAKHLIDKALLAALAVPVTKRLATIEINLERWRRSDLRHFPYAIFVNLPDYHGELRDGPEELLRFKIVIGNTTKRRGFMINATPVLTARVATVVYNPYWNVPKRIYEQELRVKAEKYAAKQAEAAAAGGGGGEPAPDYWASRGYEVKGKGKGKKGGNVWVRRRPGPGNALGKVKFIFENRWFVFLHDTPQKGKFLHTRRAFSHGCMRVQNPLELAETLLQRDGSWGEVEEARVMEHYKQTIIEVKDPVWVVVDYITTRVDEHGRVQFFADVYKKDAPKLAAK
ncbi:MAG: L,D-transpeptidase family protein, partial [Myxococcota bacterium]|nr:L,D-transpeptidase family protein [Myxococcota bacterium]